MVALDRGPELYFNPEFCEVFIAKVEFIASNFQIWGPISCSQEGHRLWRGGVGIGDLELYYNPEFCEVLPRWCVISGQLSNLGAYILGLQETIDSAGGGVG